MRKSTLTLIALAACFTVLTSVPAQAATTFTFDGIEDESSDLSISRHMTRVLGSRVQATGVEVNDNGDEWFDTYWFHKDKHDNFLRVDDRTGDMELLFNKQIIKASGNGYAFIPQFWNDEYSFNIRAYDENYGDVENPNERALVKSLSLNRGWEMEADFDMYFERPVSLLVFSDSGKQWIGVDNLTVQPVPVPGAGLLAMIGMGVTGWLKRRNTL